MDQHISYNTVTEAINGLRLRGYTIDFNIDEDCLITSENEKHFPDDFEITEVYRFEGDSDPGDEAIVYAIESKLGSKGVLIDGYGVYSESMTNDMIKKLAIHH